MEVTGEDNVFRGFYFLVPPETQHGHLDHNMQSSCFSMSDQRLFYLMLSFLSLSLQSTEVRIMLRFAQSCIALIKLGRSVERP